MNIKHIQSGSIWTKLALGQYALSLGLGIYGNSRTKFSSDFTYNKYHFGVFVNLVSGIGLWQSVKVPTPWHSGAFFLLAIGLNSFPSYYEGFQDIRDEPLRDSEIRKYSLYRKIGFYCLMGGLGVLFLKHRRLNSFM